MAATITASIVMQYPDHPWPHCLMFRQVLALARGATYQSLSQPVKGVRMVETEGQSAFECTDPDSSQWELLLELSSICVTVSDHTTRRADIQFELGIHSSCHMPFTSPRC